MASISFAGGLYYALVYQSGVLQYLQDTYDLTDVCFLGDSSGASLAYTAAIGYSAHKFLEERVIPPIEQYALMPFKGMGQWKDIQLRCGVDTGLSLADTLALSIENRLCVSITRVDGMRLRNELVTTFVSDRDAAEAVLASCHIPFLMTPHAFAEWRGAKYMDGMFSGHRPMRDARTCVIHPELWRSNAFWLQHGCVTIPTAQQARWSYRLGYDDAAKHDDFFRQHGLNKISIPHVQAGCGSTSTASCATASDHATEHTRDDDVLSENESRHCDDDASYVMRQRASRVCGSNCVFTLLRKAKMYGFVLINLIGSQILYRTSCVKKNTDQQTKNTAKQLSTL